MPTRLRGEGEGGREQNDSTAHWLALPSPPESRPASVPAMHRRLHSAPGGVSLLPLGMATERSATTRLNGLTASDGAFAPSGPSGPSGGTCKRADRQPPRRALPPTCGAERPKFAPLAAAAAAAGTQCAVAAEAKWGMAARRQPSLLKARAAELHFADTPSPSTLHA